MLDLFVATMTPISKIVLTLVFCVATFNCLDAQTSSTSENSKYRHTWGDWIGAYTTYYFKENWAYYGEYHLRTRNGLAKMGQIYLRFGVMYKPKKWMSFTAGFVNPWYWAPNQNSPYVDKVVPQFRLWQQALFKHHLPHLKITHQIRTEQRYHRAFDRGANWKWSFRFRYKLSFYVLLNSKELKDNTFFLLFYNEVFFQTGKYISFDWMEDNRAFVGFGHRINKNIDILFGYMNTFRFDKDPAKFESRHIFRICFFHRLKLYKSLDPKKDPKFYRDSF